MGQRGQRKSRRRCAFVDIRTGLRCAKQVKKAGSTYCSISHGARARCQTVKTVVEPGARAVYRTARAKDVERLTLQLRKMADEHGRVPLIAVVPVAMAIGDVRYQRGYATGRSKLRFETRKLRLTASKSALDEFLGSRFGKRFITGELRPDDLAKFKFGGSS